MDIRVGRRLFGRLSNCPLWFSSVRHHSVLCWSVCVDDKRKPVLKRLDFSNEFGCALVSGGNISHSN